MAKTILVVERSKGCPRSNLWLPRRNRRDHSFGRRRARGTQIYMEQDAGLGHCGHQYARYRRSQVCSGAPRQASRQEYRSYLSYRQPRRPTRGGRSQPGCQALFKQAHNQGRPAQKSNSTAGLILAADERDSLSDVAATAARWEKVSIRCFSRRSRCRLPRSRAP